MRGPYGGAGHKAQQGCRRLGLAVPEAPEIDAHGPGIRLIPAREHEVEVMADARAMRIELPYQRRPVARAHGEREPRLAEASEVFEVLKEELDAHLMKE